MTDQLRSEPFVTDEDIILQYRAAETDNEKSKIFKHFLSRKRIGDRPSWKLVITKYVRWRLSKARYGFDTYDVDDLSQRCLCCFYKAMSEKFDHSRQVKFSTYMYTALKKTINRVVTELRKKKRTVEIDGKRISAKFFTDSLSSPTNKNDDKSIVLGDVISEPDEDINDNQAIIAESILEKCKKYLSPMQYEIFVKSEIQGLISGKELARKYNKSEPTISAIKKRKIARALKKIRTEVTEEFNIAS
jgi:RNA polymerase sigma factor (sigma-70 family)